LDENTTNHDYLDSKVAPTNFGMESWCVDFEPKLAYEDSTLKVQNLPLLISGGIFRWAFQTKIGLG
jgi:hypothetical protein